MYPKRLLITTLILGLSACGTTSGPLNAQQNQEIAERGIALAAVPENFKPTLHMQTRGKAVAGFIFSTILSSAAASAGMSGQMPSQELTKTSMEFGKNVGEMTQQAFDRAGKEAQKSSPYLMMHQHLAKSLAQADLLKSGNDPVQMQIDNKLWELHYSGMFNSAYQLNYDLNTRLTHKASKLNRQIPCAGTYSETYTLEEWQAEDNAKIHSAADQVARHCANQVLGELGLPVITQ